MLFYNLKAEGEKVVEVVIKEVVEAEEVTLIFTYDESRSQTDVRTESADASSGT